MIRLVIGTGSEYNTKSDWGGVGLIILKSLGVSKSDLYLTPGEWVRVK